MYTRTILLVLVLLFLCAVPGTQAQTTSCTPPEDSENPFSCSITYTPTGPNTGVFDFSGSGDGILSIQFDTVLTTFTLKVTANEVASITNIDQTQLPGATCINYYGNSGNQCVRYDVSGDVGGPNGTPVRGTDYKGLITLLLNYNSFETIDIPVFGHDPELDPNFDENILTSYVDENAPGCTNCEGPAMGGKTPGISSFAALTQPFANGAQSLTVCPFVTATPQSSASGNNPLIEVSFKLVAFNGSCSAGPFLRDKTASLSVSLDTPGNLTFAHLVNGGDANKFHFDNKNGVNVQDINTNGLPSGTYLVTVSSSLFSPVTTTFTIP